MNSMIYQRSRGLKTTRGEQRNKLRRIVSKQKKQPVKERQKMKEQTQRQAKIKATEARPKINDFEHNVSLIYVAYCSTCGVLDETFNHTRAVTILHIHKESKDAKIKRN